LRIAVMCERPNGDIDGTSVRLQVLNESELRGRSISHH
jgi:hypothetical protein